MKFLGIFRKGKVGVNKAEKKSFLSNDFIERMIRVEQRVSLSLGETKQYNKTNYYKSLRLNEKKSFDEYLKGKGDVMRSFIALFSLLLFSVLFLNFNITGNVVSGVIGEEGFSILTSIIFIVFISILVVIIMCFFIRKLKNHRFQKHFSILDSVGFRKAGNKYFNGGCNC